MVIRKTFEEITIEALNRLNISFELGTWQRLYSNGLSKQVPAQFVIKIRDAKYRNVKLGIGKRLVQIE